MNTVSVYNGSSIFDDKGEIAPFNHSGDTTYRILGSAPLVEHVTMTPLAYQKMMEFTKHCDLEISWLGTVKQEGWNLHIEDVYLFKQEVSSGATELDEHAMSKFAEDLLTDPPDGDIDKASDLINRIRMWGHSHVKMGTTPSGTDDKTMDEFAENVRNTDMPFMIRLICNKLGSLRIDVYQYDIGVAKMNAKWSVKYPEAALSDTIKSEMRDKVSRKSYSYQGNKSWEPGKTVTSGH
jgi:hypothetical protein